MTMRVANIIEESRWGGPQKRIVLVASALRDFGIDTVVLHPSCDADQFKQSLLEANIDSKCLSLHRLGRGWVLIFYYLVSFPLDVFRIWMYLIANRARLDLLHVSGGAWQIKGPIAGWLAGIPVIWHLNDTQMPTLLVTLFKFVSRTASAYIVAARRVQDYYFSSLGGNKKLISHVPAPVLSADLSRHNFSECSTIASCEAVRIVTVANITPVKGIELLVDVCEILSKNCIAYSLHIAGSIHASQRNYFDSIQASIKEQGVSESVYFHGRKNNIGEILKAADIYVCSSVAEASPMSVWEAMSMECAIVSTDVGDVSLYIQNGYNGFIVPVGDSQAMADAIIKLVNTPELRKLFGKRAREVACRELDINIIAAKTAEAYRSVLEKARLK